MNKQQSGFTLIELIAVIVILGILAAVAVPKFVDLSEAAEEATVKGVAGALGSASALNHANNVALDAGLTATGVTDVAACEEVGGLLDGGLPGSGTTGDATDDYVITTGTGTVIDTGVDTEGGSSSCTVTSPGGVTATFVAYGVDAP